MKQTGYMERYYPGALYVWPPKKRRLRKRREMELVEAPIFVLRITYWR